MVVNPLAERPVRGTDLRLRRRTWYRGSNLNTWEVQPATPARFSGIGHRGAIVSLSC